MQAELQLTAAKLDSRKHASWLLLTVAQLKSRKHATGLIACLSGCTGEGNSVAVSCKQLRPRATAHTVDSLNGASQRLLH